MYSACLSGPRSRPQPALKLVQGRGTIPRGLLALPKDKSTRRNSVLYVPAKGGGGSLVLRFCVWEGCLGDPTSPEWPFSRVICSSIICHHKPHPGPWGPRSEQSGTPHPEALGAQQQERSREARGTGERRLSQEGTKASPNKEHLRSEVSTVPGGEGKERKIRKRGTAHSKTRAERLGGSTGEGSGRGAGPRGKERPKNWG